MKGIVFTEFLEMVEERYSLEMVDQLIEQTKPPSGGSYTAVGTYPPAELMSLLGALAERTDTAPQDLLRTFGRFLFGRFASRGYESFLANTTSTLDFLEIVETVIHVDVKKLYPEAELPTFTCERVATDKLVMVYRSPRRLSALAEGLMRGCADHFKETIDIAREDLSDASGEKVRFTVTRSGAA